MSYDCTYQIHAMKPSLLGDVSESTIWRGSAYIKRPFTSTSVEVHGYLPRKFSPKDPSLLPVDHIRFSHHMTKR